MLPPQEIVFLKRAHDRTVSQGLNTRASAETQILLTCSFLSHAHICKVYLFSVCVCVLCREKMPFHHVRAGLLYPDNYLSSSLTEGSESFQLTSISTEELGGECADTVRVGGWWVWWGSRVKCEVLAINVSRQEQCSYNAPILPGKSFSI